MRNGRKRAADDARAGQDQENPRQLVRSLGHQENRHAEAAVAAELHQHAGMQHRDGRRSRSMTVGRPRMEREHRAEHAEADERERENRYCALIGIVCLDISRIFIESCPPSGAEWK